MGVGVSLYPLASAVAQEGGLGIVSSACLDRLLSKRMGKKYKIVHISAELAPFAKAGGLGDAVSGLTTSLSQNEDLDITIIIPCYDKIIDIEDFEAKELSLKCFEKKTWFTNTILTKRVRRLKKMVF